MYHFYRSSFYKTVLRGGRSFQTMADTVPARQRVFGMTPKHNQHQEFAGPRFVQLPNAEAVGRKAAGIVGEQLAEKPDSTIVFPTGKTPLPMYAALRQMPEIDWTHSRLFQLDEYVPPVGSACAPYEASSCETSYYETFAQFMDRELWRLISGQKYYIQDYFGNPAAYERLLAEQGGPDLVVLGIGRNGHVAFNEPGSPPDSGMRIIDLAEQTIHSNFGQTSKPVPTQAMTLGLKNILQARHIVLLATGTGKQEIVGRAFDPSVPPSVDCPASWLKRHPSITLITDFERH